LLLHRGEILWRQRTGLGELGLPVLAANKHSIDHAAVEVDTPPEILAAYEQVRGGVVEEDSKTHPNSKKVYVSYSKCREDFKLWSEDDYLKR
jgi:TRAP-type mannitol/chloroaromatic compound transport system substrate-binding protein